MSTRTRGKNGPSSGSADPSASADTERLHTLVDVACSQGAGGGPSGPPPLFAEPWTAGPVPFPAGAVGPAGLTTLGPFPAGPVPGGYVRLVPATLALPPQSAVPSAQPLMMAAAALPPPPGGSGNGGDSAAASGNGSGASGPTPLQAAQPPPPPLPPQPPLGGAFAARSGHASQGPGSGNTLPAGESASATEALAQRCLRLEEIAVDLKSGQADLKTTLGEALATVKTVKDEVAAVKTGHATCLAITVARSKIGEEQASMASSRYDYMTNSMLSNRNLIQADLQALRSDVNKLRDIVRERVMLVGNGGQAAAAAATAAAEASGALAERLEALEAGQQQLRACITEEAAARADDRSEIVRSLTSLERMVASQQQPRRGRPPVGKRAAECPAEGPAERETRSTLQPRRLAAAL